MLKRKYHPNAGEKYYNERFDTEEAIDTVVTELEKDVIMEDKLMMILRQLYDHKINIIEAFNRITVREEAK